MCRWGLWGRASQYAAHPQQRDHDAKRKLTPALALETQRFVRPTFVATGKMNLEDFQEFLDAASDNGQIQQKANSRALMDYGLLADVLKTRRPK